MVQRLIASAVVSMALGSLGWAAGAEIGDPFRARHPLPAVKPHVAAGCHLAPQLEVVPVLDDEPGPGLAEYLHAEEQRVRDQLISRANELSICAKIFGEPGAQQLARVTLTSDGQVHQVRVQGPYVSDGLRDCVAEKTSHWFFPESQQQFVLTLPVQYCPGS